jgi:hypothetical protein
MAFYPDIYETLTHNTKLCMRRTKWKFGKPYSWMPRRHLVRRIAEEFGLSQTEAFNRLMEIKQHVQKYPAYF